MPYFPRSARTFAIRPTAQTYRAALAERRRGASTWGLGRAPPDHGEARSHLSALIPELERRARRIAECGVPSTAGPAYSSRGVSRQMWDAVWVTSEVCHLPHCELWSIFDRWAEDLDLSGRQRWGGRGATRDQARMCPPGQHGRHVRSPSDVVRRDVDHPFPTTQSRNPLHQPINNAVVGAGR